MEVSGIIATSTSFLAHRAFRLVHDVIAIQPRIIPLCHAEVDGLLQFTVIRDLQYLNDIVILVSIDIIWHINRLDDAF
jgi:hypothetical protein